MKKSTLLLLITLIAYTLCAQKNNNTRQIINLNREWKYCPGDFKEAAGNNFDDQAWETLNLPHSFSIPYFMSKDFYIGYGWYRKTLPLNKKEITWKIFLEFDGVFQEAEIFVNNQLAGKHLGGYTGFSVDISAFVKEGNNQLAVRVNNLWRPDLAPRAGEHVFSGGIYRNVRLVFKSTSYINWYGTFVTTPTLAANEGRESTVKINTEICNQSGKTATYRLKTEILDSTGRIVTQIESSQEAGNGDIIEFCQQTSPIPQPALWQPEHPALYRAVTILYEGKRELDRTETSFGFRWFNWTADQGFFLNGKHLYLRGANVHQDHAGWGDAVTEKGMLRDVQQIREAGFNFIRGSHYPHSSAFSEACDREGILFWSEAAFWGIGGFKGDGYWNSSAYPIASAHKANFEASALQQLTEMIRIHRNHPSIVVWSMSNEPFFSAPEAMDGVRNLLTRMVALSRQLDPTRPAAVGGVQRPLGANRIDLLGDIAGYNGDGSSISDFQNPPIPNIISEYGSTTADRPGDYTPGWGDLARNDGWKGFPWRSGQAIWCGFDHGSIAGSDLGKMGIIDYFRIPKKSWYWYRNEYRQIAPPEWPQAGIPSSLSLEADQTQDILTDGTDDVKLSITVLDAQNNPINNSPDIKLSVVEGPGEFPTGSTIIFSPQSDIRIIDGKAAIEFRSSYAGKTIIRATSPGITPAEITLSFKGGPQYERGKTQQVKDRPYSRYVRKEQAQILQTFGRNNPTFASSSAPGHAAGMAADGDQNTWWQPVENDPAPYWISDTEKGLVIKSIKIFFPEAVTFQYKVETSEDQKNWKPVFNHWANVQSETVRTIMPTTGTTGRFVRVSFKPGTSVPRIAEIEVSGMISN